MACHILTPVLNGFPRPALIRLARARCWPDRIGRVAQNRKHRQVVGPDVGQAPDRDKLQVGREENMGSSLFGMGSHDLRLLVERRHPAHEVSWFG